jgi:CspA family cold shock protein
LVWLCTGNRGVAGQVFGVESLGHQQPSEAALLASPSPSWEAVGRAVTVRRIGLNGQRNANWTSKFFNADRGYGFIAPDGGGSDVFVHVHEVESAGIKTLVKGQPLTYNTAPARDGRLKAVNLRLLSR